MPTPAQGFTDCNIDQPDLLVQVERESFHITAIGGEGGFGLQGLQAAGAGGR